MKIKVEKVTVKDLKPGDLFTKYDQFYWDHRMPVAVGEKVYIRTEAPLNPAEKDLPMYRVTIEK